VELITADKRAMLTLPPAPPPTGWRLPTVIGPRPFVRFESNLYSVRPDAVGRRAEIIADLAQVTVLCDGRLAARHRRSWTRDQTIVDPDHLADAALTRKDRR
jgi:hypothetical protein